MNGQPPQVTAPTDHVVLQPAGLPLAEAATWVGQACWAELRLFEVLTAWLAVEDDPQRTLDLWAARADTAERAEAWHRRLPELREFPRSDWVAPSSPAVAQLFDELAALTAPADGPTRPGALAAVLRGIRLGYHRHQSVAVGAADGPVAVTLHHSLRSTFDAAEGDPDPAWTATVDAAGGLP